MNTRILLATLGLAALLPAAHAELITVQNAGFETLFLANNTFNVASPGPAGWSAYGTINHNNRSIGVVNPTGSTLYSGGAPEGRNVGVVFLMDNANNQSQYAGIESGLVQTLAATLQTNTRYTLTVEVGNMANDSSANNNAFVFTGFPGYRVDLLAGGQVIASDNNSLLPSEGTFLTSQFSLSIGASHVLAGQALGIRLVNLNAAPGIEVNFDNVRLDATAIPEPATVASLFGAATLALAILIRCKAQKTALVKSAALMRSSAKTGSFA
jgi:hapalindole H/12-epi-hapalindole U/12-epi-fischerindole U synthase